MSSSPPGVVESIHRYPVKGLSPQSLTHVIVPAGGTLPSDRKYAVENGPSGFDPTHPGHFPKIKFLMLMRHERLAALKTHYDDESHTLSIRRNGDEVACGDLRDEAGRRSIEQFLIRYCDGLNIGPLRVLSAPGHSFSDVARKVVSIINLASVEAVGSLVGEKLDPLRFRGNLHVTGWQPWQEFELLDKTIAIAGVRLKVFKRIVRCAAVNVDPKTAIRGTDLPAAMQRAFQHADCGVYAEVIEGGEISQGDAIAAVEPALI